MFSLSGFLRFLLPFSILFIPWRTQLSLAYFPPSLTSFLYFSLYYSPVSPVSLSCCVLLGNNDRALCISRCKRNKTTHHQWYALPTKRALVIHSPYILPKYMFLNLPRDVNRSTACFRLRIHTLRFETAT